MRKFLQAACIGAAALGFAPVASEAAVYLMDFGGSGTPPPSNWNIIRDTTAASGDSPVGPGIWTLMDTTGSTAANVQFQIIDDVLDNHGTQSTTNLVPQVSPISDTATWLDTNILQDYLILASTASNATGLFQFDNLDNGRFYSIELVAARATTNTTTHNIQVTANGMAPDNIPTGIYTTANNKTVAAWDQLIPVNGSIVMNLSVPAGASFSVFNGLRLAEGNLIPEPASLGLLVLGGLALLRWRRC